MFIEYIWHVSIYRHSIHAYKHVVQKIFETWNVYDTYNIILSLEANNFLMEAKNSALICTSLNRVIPLHKVNSFKWNPGDCLLIPSSYIILKEKVKTIPLIPQVSKINIPKSSLTNTSKARVGHCIAFTLFVVKTIYERKLRNWFTVGDISKGILVSKIGTALLLQL